MNKGELIELGRLIFEIMLAAGGGLFAWAWWSIRREMVTKDHLATELARHDEEHQILERRLADGDRRFSAIIADMQSLPRRQDLDDLKERLGGVEGSVMALQATIEGQSEVFRRIENTLNMLLEDRLKRD